MPFGRNSISVAESTQKYELPTLGSRTAAGTGGLLHTQRSRDPLPRMLKRHVLTSMAALESIVAPVRAVQMRQPLRQDTPAPATLDTRDPLPRMLKLSVEAVGSGRWLLLFSVLLLSLCW